MIPHEFTKENHVYKAVVMHNAHNPPHYVLARVDKKKHDKVVSYTLLSFSYDIVIYIGPSLFHIDFIEELFDWASFERRPASIIPHAADMRKWATGRYAQTPDRAHPGKLSPRS